MRRQRGMTLVEILVAMVAITIGMLGTFRTIASSSRGTAAAIRFTQAQARLHQIHEAIIAAPGPVLTCLAGTAASGWAACETQCRTALGPNAAPESCVFSSLSAASEQVDSLQQAYTVVYDPADAQGRTTAVVAAGASGRVFDVAVTVGWNNDGTAPLLPVHRVTIHSAVFQ